MGAYRFVDRHGRAWVTDPTRTRPWTATTPDGPTVSARSIGALKARADAVCPAPVMSEASIGAAVETAPDAPAGAIPVLPNAITLAGYAASLAWIAGGPPALAIAGLVADEADGRVARATGQTSEFGGDFDWAADLTMTGLVALRLGMPWLLLAITPVQAYLRSQGWRPTIGSARAALTVYALIKESGE